VTKRYALCFLRDIRRATTRSQTEAKSMMDKVGKTYLQQTNVDLQLQPPQTDVVVGKNLGKPLFIGKKGVIPAILDATPDALILADVIVYCCWDVEDTRPANAAGLTSGKLSFVEDGGDPRFVAPLTFAHEVGHALGLDHTGNRNNLMFPTLDARSSKLSQFEIDTVNTSGTKA
jgi:Matrixin